MTQTQQFEADVLAIEPEGQVTFQFEGAEWIGQKNVIANRLVMVDAGREQVVDFNLDVRLKQFRDKDINPPSEESIIKIDDVEYRIVSGSLDQYGVVMTYIVAQNT